MPECKYCHARLNRLTDKDRCPVCGTKDPLSGVISNTEEVTSQVDLNHFIAGQKVVRRRKNLLILFLTVGFTGAPYFYLKKKVNGVLWLLLNLVILGGLFALFYFLLHLHLALAIILPILVSYSLNGVIGAIYNFLPDLKDGEGEFVV